MRVDVWSDVVCPWCYIGKRRLEAALESFPGRDSVEVVFHSLQLDPSTPKGSTESIDAMLARKYQLSPGQVAETQARVTRIAAGDGLEYHLDRALTENTLDAHRLIHFAASHGRGQDLMERLMAAYFTEGRRVGDADSLVAICVEAGLDGDASRAVIDDPWAYADAVRADQMEARRLGIRGVPFFVVDQRFGVSGAQPTEALLAAMSRAWSAQTAS
jgi:predicted DsbA family dithiol-disulfide isomerase